MEKQAAALWALSEVLWTLQKYSYCSTEAERQRVASEERIAVEAAKDCLEKLNLDETMLVHRRISIFQSSPQVSQILSLVVEQLDRLPMK